VVLGGPGCIRRFAIPAACVLLLALAVSGCATLQAALRTSAALQGAGYQGVNVNVATGTGEPAGGLITVAYSGEPTGNEQRDARQAEKIVWDTFPGRFGAVAVIKDSGGCDGPVCATQSSQIAGASYAQLAVSFGPRPHGLDSASPSGMTVPGWAKVLALGLAVVVIAAAIALMLILRRRIRRPDPPPRPPVPPDWPGLKYRAP
jgi:hypothetical protein